MTCGGRGGKCGKVHHLPNTQSSNCGIVTRSARYQYQSVSQSVIPSFCQAVIQRICCKEWSPINGLEGVMNCNVMSLLMSFSALHSLHISLILNPRTNSLSVSRLCAWTRKMHSVCSLHEVTNVQIG